MGNRGSGEIRQDKSPAHVYLQSVHNKGTDYKSAPAGCPVPYPNRVLNPVRVKNGLQIRASTFPRLPQLPRLPPTFLQPQTTPSDGKNTKYFVKNKIFSKKIIEI
jgi:hypothetical protein